MARVLFVACLCILRGAGKQFFLRLLVTSCLCIHALLLRHIIVAQNSGDLKLNGSSSSAGAPIIYLSRQWGTISAVNFSKDAADVACHQLGYSEALSFSVATGSTGTYVPTLYCIATLRIVVYF